MIEDSTVHSNFKYTSGVAVPVTLSDCSYTSTNEIVISGGIRLDDTYTNMIEQMDASIQKLKEELAEMWLLGGSSDEKQCIYKINYEEYMQLSGRIRL